jgi:hypothetical protein
MGVHVNRRATTLVGVTLAAGVTFMNVFLIYQQIF